MLHHMATNPWIRCGLSEESTITRAPGKNMKINTSATKTVAIIALLLGLIALVFWLHKIVSFAEAMGCSDQLVQRIDSPDGRFSAIKFNRACGATAPDSMQVNIQPFGTELDAEHYPPFLVLNSHANAVAIWTERGTLIVTLNNVTNEYRKAHESEGIFIRYVK